MAKEISYSGVSSKLHVIFAQHKNDNCVAVWQRELKGVLNNSEVRRLYELFSGDFCLLKARTDAPQFCSWSELANPDNWTKAWVENVFKDHAIQSVFGPHMIDGKMANPRKPKKPAEASVEVDPIDAQLAKIEAKMAKLQEEKEALLVKKEEERRRADAAAKLSLICEVAEISSEDLFNLVSLVHNII